MFEKEAKEYLKTDGTKAEQILNMLNEISPLKINIKQLPFVLAMIQQVYQDGAEFGYNKAKEEWKKHFMQCSSPFCLDIFSSVKCYGELGNMAKKEGEEK